MGSELKLGAHWTMATNSLYGQDVASVAVGVRSGSVCRKENGGDRAEVHLRQDGEGGGTRLLWLGQRACQTSATRVGRRSGVYIPDTGKDHNNGGENADMHIENLSH